MGSVQSPDGERKNRFKRRRNQLLKEQAMEKPTVYVEVRKRQHELHNENNPYRKRRGEEIALSKEKFE